MTALLGLTHRPDHERGVVTRRAVVLLLPSQRILGEKGETAINRSTNTGRLVSNFLGRRCCGKNDHDDDEEGSHVGDSKNCRPN